MSALVRKEIRLLFPAWASSMIFATFFVWPWHSLDGIYAFFFAGSVLTLAVSSFGKESSYGTFGLLLTQPVERRRIWRVKIGLMAAALLSVAATLLLFSFLALHAPSHADRDYRERFLEVVKTIGYGLVMVVIFSGGLWTTLLLREPLPALLCTCLAPGLLAVVTVSIIGRWLEPEDLAFDLIMNLVLTGYSVAGFIWAYRLFMRAEDVGWSGGQISLRSMRWLAFECKAKQSKWTSLIKKELQMQEVTMVLVPLLAVLHFAALAICHFHPKWLGEQRELLACLIPFIWMGTVPLVIGCVAVSEERRLNTFENLLCLPVSKLASFTVKLAVCLVLAIVLGGVLPLTLLRLSGWGPHDLEKGAILGLAVGLPAIITAVAFYASTMSRGLLQSLPVLVACAFVPWAVGAILDAWFLRDSPGNYQMMQSSIFPAIAWPTVILTILVLGYSNYKRLLTGWSLWIENFLKLGATFLCAAVALVGIYNREWEVFERLEPVHGPARISGQGRAALGAWRGIHKDPMHATMGLYALLPDGRLWLGTVDHNFSVRTADTYTPGSYKNVSGEFVPGSNWVQLACGLAKEPFALRSDGTLWKIGRTNVSQVGTDTNWKQIAGCSGGFLGLKKDGTLWNWSIAAETSVLPHVTQNRGRISKDSGVEVALMAAPSRNTQDPERIGEDSDWETIFVVEDHIPITVKRDGTWRADYGLTRSGGTWRSFALRMTGTNWASISGIENLLLGVRRDGTLWGAGYLPSTLFGERVIRAHSKEAGRIGDKSDWVMVSGFWPSAALKANGTLWATENGLTKKPSEYSDWVAVAEDSYNFTWALAKDGTLTCWNPFGVNQPGIDNGKAPTFMQNFFLGPTRKPVVSGNIFDKNL